MARKPTIASLKRELAASDANVTNWYNKAESIRLELAAAQEKIRDLEGDKRALDKQVGWYERERENTLEYFDEALKLFKPHLVPGPHGGIEIPDNSLERFLLQVRERLSRYYDALGRNLYMEGLRR